MQTQPSATLESQRRTAADAPPSAPAAQLLLPEARFEPESQRHAPPGRGPVSRAMQALGLTADTSLQPMGWMYGRPDLDKADQALQPFPRSLAEWNARLFNIIANPRQLHTDLYAEMLNETLASPHNAGQTHEDLVRQLATDAPEKFRVAAGVPLSEWNNTFSNYWTFGRLFPTSGTLVNSVPYIGLPLLNLFHEGARTWMREHPWAVLGATVAWSGGAAPVLTAPIQTAAVASLDTWRQRNGWSFQLHGSVNAKRTPAKIDADIQALAAEMAQGGKLLRDQLGILARQYGVIAPDAGSGYRLTGAEIVETVRQARAEPDPQVRALNCLQLLTLQDGQEDRKWQMLATAQEMRMMKGVMGRVEDAYSEQSGWRTLRAFSAFASRVGEHLRRAGKAGVGAPYIAQIAVAGTAMVGHHLHGAARDEGAQAKGALTNEIRLQLLYGDALNDEGKAALRRGDPIVGRHVHEPALREVFVEPEVKMVKNIIGLLDAGDPDKALLQDLYDAAIGKRGGEGLRGLDQLGAGGKARALVRNAIAKKEIGFGRLAFRVPMPKALANIPWKFGAKAGWHKMTAAEFWGQVAQREQSAWHMLVGGNVAATVLGGMLIAIAGGTSKAHMSLQYMAALVSTLAGWYGATTQHIGVNIKNELRADPQKVNKLQQMGHAVLAALWQHHQLQHGEQGLQTAGRAIAGTRLPAAAEHAMRRLHLDIARLLEQVAAEVATLPAEEQAAFRETLVSNMRLEDEQEAQAIEALIDPALAQHLLDELEATEERTPGPSTRKTGAAPGSTA